MLTPPAAFFLKWFFKNTVCSLIKFTTILLPLHFTSLDYTFCFPNCQKNTLYFIPSLFPHPVFLLMNQVWFWKVSVCASWNDRQDLILGRKKVKAKIKQIKRVWLCDYYISSEWKEKCTSRRCFLCPYHLPTCYSPCLLTFLPALFSV